MTSCEWKPKGSSWMRSWGGRSCSTEFQPSGPRLSTERTFSTIWWPTATSGAQSTSTSPYKVESTCKWPSERWAGWVQEATDRKNWERRRKKLCSFTSKAKSLNLTYYLYITSSERSMRLWAGSATNTKLPINLSKSSSEAKTSTTRCSVTINWSAQLTSCSPREKSSHASPLQIKTGRPQPPFYQLLMKLNLGQINF